MVDIQRLSNSKNTCGMTPSQKLIQMNLAFKEAIKQNRLRKIARVNTNNPLYTIMETMARKGKMDETFLDNNREKYVLKRKKDLSWAAKEEIYNMEQNWARQPFKMYHCHKCDLDIPGPQEVFLKHAHQHFTQENEGMELKASPYKYI